MTATLLPCPLCSAVPEPEYGMHRGELRAYKHPRTQCALINWRIDLDKVDAWNRVNSAGKTAAQQSEGEATLQSFIRSEALEVLQEVYTACLSGDFYADHDEATRLLGTMRRALKEGK